MKENRAVPTDQDLNVVWLTESEASRITEHKDDPEEESTQSDEETVEKLRNTFQQQFGKLYDAEGRAVSVKSQAEGRTDKCNAELVKPAQEGSQKGISDSRLT